MALALAFYLGEGYDALLSSETTGFHGRGRMAEHRVEEKTPAPGGGGGGPVQTPSGPGGFLKGPTFKEIEAALRQGRDEDILAALKYAEDAIDEVLLIDWNNINPKDWRAKWKLYTAWYIVRVLRRRLARRLNGRPGRRAR
ncbi:MAG: hypothetical protein C4291_14545 [Candidatus Dadabacteria bacterium]